MSEVPPPYANYPRNAAPYGSAAQLQSLYDGYRKYGWLFLLNIVVFYAILAIALITRSDLAILLSFPLTATIMGFACHPMNLKIGYGAGWPPSQVVVASVLMGINSVTCGIIGYIVMQSIAMNHIKRYGLKSGFFGLKKREVKQRILDLEAAEVGGPGY